MNNICDICNILDIFVKRYWTSLQMVLYKWSITIIIIIKYTSKAYVDVSLSLSNASVLTQGSLHHATLQAELIILYLSCGWRSSLNIRS